MKARIIRILFGLHRWAGVLLGALMLLWCLSGFVMMYSPYPATSLNGRDYRMEGLPPLAAPDAPDALAAMHLPDDTPIRSARVEMAASEPVLFLAWQGGQGAFNLSDGQPIDSVDEAGALAVAQTYAGRHGIAATPEVKALTGRDEFVVAGYFNSGRPYWQVRLNDADGTMLYVSSTTGEIRQRTTDSLRFWSWLGAIPHWLYFTELRKDGRLWTDIVIWTSLGGCFLVALGMFVGLRQLRRRKSTGRLASPYHGAKFWHHMFGLVFGVLVLTWTFSGFASMQPWGWLETGQEAGSAAGRLSGETPAWAQVRPALASQIAAAAPDTIQVTLTAFDGQPHFIHTVAGGERTRFGADGAPAPFDAASQSRAAEILAGDYGAADVSLMEKEDAYYYDGAAAGRLPVVKVVVPAMENTAFYLDPVSGQVRAIADPGARGFRWLHLGLHRMDFFGWMRVRPFWDILVWTLMLGVTAVCAFGVWLAGGKLLRGGRLDGRPKDRPQNTAES